MKIIISGASRGLGLSLAKKLCESNQLITFARGESTFQHPNIKHYAGVDLMEKKSLECIEHELADADALVNNVGFAHDGILATESLENIEKMIEINLISVFYLTKAYLRSRLPTCAGGNVITISSVVSIRGFSGLSVYSATKGALNSMTTSLARESGGKGFRFNAVLPGYFDSEMSEGMPAEKKHQIIRRTPLGRLAKTDDITPIVEFLLSDNARFITGQLIAVDGGFTC